MANMNTLSGRGPFGNVSAFDTNLSSRSIVSESDRAVAVVSVPVSCSLLTPTKTAPHMSLNGIQSPNVFTGYPVLTLPSPGGSPRHRSSPSRTPRKARSPASPHRSRLLTKATLEGQPRIDQFYQPTVSSQSTSMLQSSSMPLFGHSSSSEIRPFSALLDREQAQPDKVSVSPLLSRNREHFVKMSPAKDFLSSNISAGSLNGSITDCTGSDMQRENYAFDVAAPIKTDLVEQPVSVDVMPETAAVKNTQVAAAEAQLESLKVSSAGCSNSTASQIYNEEKTATFQSQLKISMPRLQKMRQIWEKNCASVCVKPVKTCSSSAVTSEASVSLSSLVVSTGVDCAVTNSGAPSCATPASATAETSTNATVISSQKRSSSINSDVTDTVECVNACHIDRHSVSIASDSFKAVSEPAVNMDVSGDECDVTKPSNTDGEVINAATHKCPDISLTSQQIVLDHGVKCNGVDSDETTSMPAAEVDAPNEGKHSYLNGADNHMDVDSCTLEDFEPVESKPFFFTLLVLTEAKSIITLTHELVLYCNV